MGVKEGGKSLWEWGGGWGRGSCGETEREGISYGSCLLPGARCSLLWLAQFLGIISTLLFQGMLVYPRVDDIWKTGLFVFYQLQAAQILTAEDQT